MPLNARIMLNAFASLKCPKKCYHNVQKPWIMAFETFYSYTEYLPPNHNNLIGSLRIARGFSPEMILEVETPECWGHNFHVTVVGTGHVPQIKNSPKVSSSPDHYLLLAISPRENLVINNKPNSRKWWT